MKIAMIRYTLNDSTSRDDLKAAVDAFTAGLKAADPAIRYTSYQLGDTKDFVHVGRFPSPETLEAAQAQPFFGEFASWLKPRCTDGPNVTFMTEVGSTHDS